MTSLFINWIIILIIGFLLARQLKPFKAFYSGIISLVIGTIITYLVHSVWIASSSILWSIIAVSHASFWSGLFTHINAE